MGLDVIFVVRILLLIHVVKKNVKFVIALIFVQKKSRQGTKLDFKKKVQTYKEIK
jgi:hypothetical protein